MNLIKIGFILTAPRQETAAAVGGGDAFSGGFLCGFDTAMISGAEQTMLLLWQLDDVSHGLAVAIALDGTVIGASPGGYLLVSMWEGSTVLARSLFPLAKIREEAVKS